MSAPARPGEFELIARYFAPFAAPGAFGLLDDAAALTPPAGHDLVLTKDALIAGVHFFADDPPDMIARKALRVNLSDLAAKGAAPLGFLLGLGLHDGWTEAWMEAFAGGLADDSRAYNCPLYGGDTVSTRDRLMLSVTAIGAVPQGGMVRRGGGRPGDHLYVSGTIGDGALGLIEWRRQQTGEPFVQELARRYLVPQPRMELAPALRKHARAAMDVSDGLVGDAGKLASASGCGLVLQLGDVPLSAAARAVIADNPVRLLCAVTGGDDYEILAAVPPDAGLAFETAARSVGISVTRIGALTAPESGVAVTGPDGAPVKLTAQSYRHF